MILPLQAWAKLPRGEGPWKPPSSAVFKPVEQSEVPWVKPRRGGLWTSTFHPDTGSAWIQWALGEEFGCRSGEKFRVFTLLPTEARVYTIDGYDDLAELVAMYPAAWPTHQYPASLAREYPDWSKVAEEWDAVHLTDRGQWQTRHSMPHSLYGWDCESTLWFRWKFSKVRDLGEQSYTYADPYEE